VVRQRTIAALNRQQPDRVPVFSCTEEQNQIYEILGEEGSAVLLRPMIGQLRTVLEALTEAGLRSQVRVVIGGACTTPRLAEEMGCDAHGPDAVAAGRICEGLLAA
jgi:5-methyltetrahydrofolate--homocysteine methyltransferase